MKGGADSRSLTAGHRPLLIPQYTHCSFREDTFWVILPRPANDPNPIVIVFNDKVGPLKSKVFVEEKTALMGI